MTPDHEAALAKCRAWPHKSNTAACYLDAMARLAKAEKVCEAFHRCRVISRVTKDGRTVAAIEDQARVQELYEAYTDYRAFLAAERK